MPERRLIITWIPGSGLSLGIALHKACQRTAAEEEHAGWQGISTLQKLHNLAVWLRSSSIQSDMWRGTVGISLGTDNATRWSS
jgi:hypothetical protein